MSSTKENQELGMPKFSPQNGTNTQTGMYFCSDDQVSSNNVKFGSIQSAEENCKRILTPKICDNQSLAYALRDLAVEAQEGLK